MTGSQMLRNIFISNICTHQKVYTKFSCQCTKLEDATSMEVEQNITQEQR